MKKLLILIPAALLFVTTCSPPPFDLAISQSAKAATKMTLMGQVGPINPQTSNQGIEDFVFIPEKDGAGGITLQAGFTYLMDPVNGQQISFIASNGGAYKQYGFPMGLGPLSTDPYPNFMVQSVKSLHSVVVFQFDDNNPSNSQYQLIVGNTGTNTFTPGGWVNLHSSYTDFPPFNPPMNNAKIIGISIYPDVSFATDRTYWLFRQSGTNNYLEGRFDISQNPIITTGGNPLRGPVAYDLSPIVGPSGKRVFYYFDPVSNKSYVSIFDSPAAPSVWSTWVWVDTVPTYSQLSRIDHPIGALLTTGELFSTDGNVGRVYDPATSAGSLEAEFSMGNLRYIGEEYIGGTPMVLFSLAVWSKGQVTFTVYSIPTSSLKSLGN